MRDGRPPARAPMGMADDYEVHQAADNVSEQEQVGSDRVPNRLGGIQIESEQAGRCHCHARSRQKTFLLGARRVGFE